MKPLAIVKLARLQDLLVDAFEGGSNYWYQITGYDLAPGLKFDDFREGGRLQPKDDYWHWSQLIPATKGCCIFVKAEDDYLPVALNKQALRYGAAAMAEKYPQHWKDVLDENDDACTGDVFLQCCMFGEVIYG